MIKASFFVILKGEVREGLSHEQIMEAHQSGKGVLWVDFEDPREDDARFLSEVFGFHPLTIEDCLSPRIHPPKIDQFDDHLFINAHGVERREGVELVEAVELNMFLGAHFVVSSHNFPMPQVDRIIALAREAHASTGVLKGSDSVAHGLLDALVDDMLPVIDSLSEMSVDVQSRILQRPQPDALTAIMALKRSALRVARTATFEEEVLDRLSRGDFPYVSQKMRIYYRDVYDHVVRIVTLANHLREMTDSAITSYLSAMSNRINDVMRLLSLVAAIILPLTLVTGIYGMNFDNMPELRWRYGYFVVLGLMGTVSLGLLAYFKKRGWV